MICDGASSNGRTSAFEAGDGGSSPPAPSTGSRGGLRDECALLWELELPDGRMAKVKRRDLGLPWPVPMKLFP